MWLDVAGTSSAVWSLASASPTPSTVRFKVFDCAQLKKICSVIVKYSQLLSIGNSNQRRSTEYLTLRAIHHALINLYRTVSARPKNSPIIRHDALNQPRVESHSQLRLLRWYKDIVLEWQLSRQHIKHVVLIQIQTRQPRANWNQGFA